MTGICKRCGEQVCSCDLVDYLGEPLERQLRKRIEQLEHENAELRRDAERYWWLRHGDNDDLVLKHCGIRWQDVFLLRNEKLDDAIDAAMKEQA